MLTDHQRQWIAENRLPGPRARWLYSSNARPVLDELIAAGAMQFVSGEFRSFKTDKTLKLLGREVPVEDLVSVCTLTRRGETALGEVAL